jgi:hypothetical protein
MLIDLISFEIGKRHPSFRRTVTPYIYTRAIRKVTSVYFRQLMWECERDRACEVTSHDSLPCKPSHNWSPSVCSCLYGVSYAIDNPASCEIRSVIRFLHAKIMSDAEINCELCAVYGKNIMSKGSVRRWCRKFKDGRTNVQYEERNGRPSVVSDDLIQNFKQIICERRYFTIQKSRVNFHKFYALFSTRLSQLG